MPLYYLLPSPQGHHHYQTAQLAAFAVYVALLLGQGYRRGYPQRAWLPLVAAATLALVLGCQLVLLPPGQWLAWLGGDAAAVQALAGGPRSIIGGAVASFLVVAGLRRALDFRGWGVFDAFAGPLCWALAVQSVGCVLAGCCWGEATTGPWGVAYGPGTPAYAAQVAQGLLPAAAAHTGALVPTQLLHLLLCAGVGLLLHVLRRRAASWPGGSRYLLAMGLLCLGRFAIEGYRDPASEPILNQSVTLAGVSLMGFRWFMLLEAVGQLGLWAWLVRRAPAVAPEATPAPHAAAPALVGLGLLLATARLAPTVLSLPEIAALQALLLLVLLAEARTLLVTLGRGVPRLAGLPLAVLLGGALLLATAQAPAPQRGAGTGVTVSGGVLGNQYDERPSGDCSASPYTYGHRSTAVGGEVAYQWAPDSANTLFNAAGGGLWAGSEDITIQRIDPTSSYAPVPDLLGQHGLYDVHLYAEGNRQGGGDITLSYRAGVHLGQLGKQVIGNTAAIRTFRILPEAMLLVGKRQLIYGQFDIGYGPENALGSYAVRAGVGSGLGQRFGSSVLLGMAESYHDAGSDDQLNILLGFASANLRLPASTGLGGLSLEPYFATGFNRHYLFSLKLHYRLGLK